MSLPVGLYEALMTGDRKALIKAATDMTTTTGPLEDDAAALVIAEHLKSVVLRALRGLPADGRKEQQVELANRLLTWLAVASPKAGIDHGDAVESAELLLSVLDPAEARLGAGGMTRPILPLRHSDLLVNGPRDMRVGHAIRHELPSADRVDVLMSFLKFSGLRYLLPELRDFMSRRPGALRVLTTTYMNATEVEAIEALLELGAEVKLSYDGRRTRLHAKAWLFHRESQFSTALIGSSNLSHSALVDGCEWNVRLSQVDNRTILAKFQVTFEQYWADPGFEPYDRERFVSATMRRDPARDALATLSRDWRVSRRIPTNRSSSTPSKRSGAGGTGTISSSRPPGRARLSSRPWTTSG